jgi:hypothetical protein
MGHHLMTLPAPLAEVRHLAILVEDAVYPPMRRQHPFLTVHLRAGNQAAAAASAPQTPPPKPSPASAKSTPTPSRSATPKPSPAAPRSTPQSASTSLHGEAAPYRDVSTYTADAKLRKALTQLEGSAGSAKPKPKLHVVVLGHVDAGKSTLMGRLVHDLGFVDPVKAAKNMREAEKAGRGSFGWAWVLDERPDERARGVTIDISLKSFETPRCARHLCPCSEWLRSIPGALAHKHAGAHMAPPHALLPAMFMQRSREGSTRFSLDLCIPLVCSCSSANQVALEHRAVTIMAGMQVCGDAAGRAGPQGLHSQHDHRRSAGGRRDARG